jgi:mannose-6-phosphate isomerase-like protein (cupin superfamily)
MSKSRPLVVHPDEGIPLSVTPDTEKRHFVDPNGRWIGWAGWIRNDAGDVSGWHHHAANDTHVYIIRGSVTIDFGPGGAESLVARAGDFFIIPSQTIHRERTGGDAELEAFIFRIGGEPEKVDVDGPDAPVGAA